MQRDAGLSWPERARLWDAASRGLRSYLRGEGLIEVMTPARVAAPAIEPWIEPIRAGAGYLRTSPELAIKGLLARGVGSCFELAKVFRAGEVGDWHREEFHLLEWYRVAPPGAADARAQFVELRSDVEALVAAAATWVAQLAREGGLEGVHAPQAPTRWETWTFDALWRETTGSARPTDTPAALREAIESVSGSPIAPLVPPHDGIAEAGARPDDATRGSRDAVEVLEAWSELFSWWSDGALDPWLETRAAGGVGVHVTDFPAPLAALSQVDAGPAGRAQRFESFIGRVELANGYLELADAQQQRTRFECVSAMRERAGLARLPLDETFLAAVDALPPCAGVALGLERLLAWATGAQRLDQLTLELGAPIGAARG